VGTAKFVFLYSHTTPELIHDPAREGDYVFAGGYSNRDYDTLLEAARGLPQRVVIAAPRHCLPAATCPANVEILGEVGEEEFYRLLSASAIVAVTLKGGCIEPGGRQVFENAMSIGKPVVVASEWAEDYIEDGVTGILVPPGDANRLRSALTLLIEDRTRAREMGQRAQAAAAAFTPEKFFEGVFALAEECLKQGRPAREPGPSNPVPGSGQER